MRALFILLFIVTQQTYCQIPKNLDDLLSAKDQLKFSQSHSLNNLLQAKGFRKLKLGQSLDSLFVSGEWMKWQTVKYKGNSFDCLRSEAVYKHHEFDFMDRNMSSISLLFLNKKLTTIRLSPDFTTQMDYTNGGFGFPSFVLDTAKFNELYQNLIFLFGEPNIQKFSPSSKINEDSYSYYKICSDYKVPFSYNTAIWLINDVRLQVSVFPMIRTDKGNYDGGFNLLYKKQSAMSVWKDYMDNYDEKKDGDAIQKQIKQVSKEF